MVHDDFLTFRPCKKYAAIVMNPPFSAGAAHLLKALDVMKDGGKIRCLLNAETIRNPCTNERKELAAQLEKLNATVKYIPDAFKNARRAARVEVALVSVDIPEREPVSKIRLELQHETTERLKTDPELAALVSADPITAAIERYNAAAEGIRRIFEEYNGSNPCFPLPRQTTMKAKCLHSTGTITRRSAACAPCTGKSCLTCRKSGTTSPTICRTNTVHESPSFPTTISALITS